jgi:excisionase family DNA binding protein
MAELEPIAVSPRAACQMLGISTATLYQLMRAGSLRSFTIGRARRIFLDSIRSYAESQPRHQGGRVGQRIGQKAAEIRAPAA